MKEDLENLKEQLDHAGPFGSLSQLKETLINANPDVRCDPFFGEQVGFLHGRMMHEDQFDELPFEFKNLIFDDNGFLQKANGLKLKKSIILGLSFKELGTFLSQARKTSLKNSYALAYAKGLYFGQQIHEEFGGIEEDTYDLSEFESGLNGYKLCKKKIIERINREKKTRLEESTLLYFAALRIKYKREKDQKRYDEEYAYYCLLKKYYKAYFKWKQRVAAIEELERELEKFLIEMEEEHAIRLRNAIQNYGFHRSYEIAVYNITNSLIEIMFYDDGPRM